MRCIWCMHLFFHVSSIPALTTFCADGCNYMWYKRCTLLVYSNDSKKIPPAFYSIHSLDIHSRKLKHPCILIYFGKARAGENPHIVYLLIFQSNTFEQVVLYFASVQMQKTVNRWQDVDVAPCMADSWRLRIKKLKDTLVNHGQPRPGTGARVWALAWL